MEQHEQEDRSCDREQEDEPGEGHAVLEHFLSWRAGWETTGSSTQRLECQTLKRRKIACSERKLRFDYAR